MKASVWIAWAMIPYTCSALAACDNAPPVIAPVTSSLLNPTGNITLHVVNRSLTREEVDIEVRIDGDVVVHDLFAVSGRPKPGVYTLALSPGKHTVRVASTTGGLELAQDFVVTGQHWGEVAYLHAPWYSQEPTPPRLKWTILDRPIEYD